MLASCFVFFALDSAVSPAFLFNDMIVRAQYLRATMEMLPSQERTTMARETRATCCAVRLPWSVSLVPVTPRFHEMDASRISLSIRRVEMRYHVEGKVMYQNRSRKIDAQQCHRQVLDGRASDFVDFREPIQRW